MIYLTFDSNIWVYLLDNSWTASNPLDHLEHWVKENHVKILVPDIVLEEWNNLKDNQRAIRVRKIREFFIMAQEIIPTAFVDQYNNPGNLEKIVEDQFARIENLIYGLCDKIEITDEIRLKSVQRVTSKLAPNRKKDSLADTLIILSLFDFAAQNPGNEYIFISNNLDDFYQRQPFQIHPDLRPDFDSYGIRDYRFLVPAIDELKTRLPVTVDLATLKKDRFKEKLEREIYNPAVSSSLIGTTDAYLENIALLDVILPKQSLTNEQALFVLNLIESDDSYAYYFFKNVKTPVWLQILIDRGTFQPHKNPEPVKVEKGFTVPLWSPMMYLYTLAVDSTFTLDNTKCKKITDILEEICKHPKDNDRTWYLLIQILEKLPNESVPESLLGYIPLWLNIGFDNSVISSLLCKDLLKKFTPENPSESDKQKSKLIIQHLFALKRSPGTANVKARKDEYYLPVYMYFLSEIPLDEAIIRSLVQNDGTWFIMNFADCLRRILFDYPGGITTTINKGENLYKLEAVVDQADVIINIAKYNSGDPLKTLRIPQILKGREDFFVIKVVEVLQSAGIPFIPEDNRDFNLERLQVPLFQGKAYTMDSVPIHKLESSDEHEDDLIALFSLMLAKLISEFCRQNPSESEKLILSIWNEYHIPLFRRIILFIIGKYWTVNRSLLTQILKEDPYILTEKHYDKELYWLLQSNSGNYTSEEKELFKNLIDAGPIDVSPETHSPYIEYWKFQWYAALKSETEFQKGYSDLSTNLNQTDPRLENMDQSILRSGSVSPFSADEILGKSNHEIVEFVKNFKPRDRWAEPNIEGMGEQLGKAVEKQPDHFAPEINLYLELPYIYIYYMLNGFREAWKNKITFDWEKVLQFCRDYTHQVRFQTGELKLSGDSWGADDEWVVGSVGTLLTAGMQKDEHAFDASLLPTVRDIIVKLTSELVLPKKISRENMDYPTYSLNSTAGKVLRALFDYSLRRARLNFKLEDKGKWEPEIKALFEDSMQKGLIDGYILQGMYFEQFMFLDDEWIKKQIEINLDIEETKWEAFIGGFVFGRAPNSREIYDLMSPHYERAIEKNIEFSRWNERTMVHHLVSFYFWGFETLEEKKLVYQFIQKSSAGAVLELVGFMGRQTPYFKSLEGDKKSGFVKMILDVWKMVVERFKNATDEDGKKTLSGSSSLLSLMPTITEETTDLVLVSLKEMTEYYHWHGVIDDLIGFSEQGNDAGNAELIGKILVKSTALPLHASYESDKLSKLVIYLYENGQKEKANQISDTISRQGHSFLREIYKKYNQ